MIDIAATSDNLSQIQAWELWFQNVNISDKTLILGISVRGWGRVGKCMQALAALTVLLDIIGADAVSRFGKRLTELTTTARAKYVAAAGFQIFADVFVRESPGVMFRARELARRVFRLGVAVAVCFAPGRRREKRLATLGRAFRRGFKVILFSKKGTRRRNRWRARRLSAGVKVERFEEKFVIPVVFVFSAVVAIYLSYDEYGADISQALFLTLSLFVAIGALTMILIRILLSIFLLAAVSLTLIIDAVLIEPTAWVIGHPKNENLLKGISLVVFIIGFYFDLLAS